MTSQLINDESKAAHDYKDGDVIEGKTLLQQEMIPRRDDGLLKHLQMKLN